MSNNPPQPADPVQVPDPKWLEARVSLCEALILHLIPAEERRALIEDMLDRVRASVGQDPSLQHFLSAAEALGAASTTATHLDRLYKHPDHQGS